MNVLPSIINACMTNALQGLAEVSLNFPLWRDEKKNLFVFDFLSSMRELTPNDLDIFPSTLLDGWWRMVNTTWHWGFFFRLSRYRNTRKPLLSRVRTCGKLQNSLKYNDSRRKHFKLINAITGNSSQNFASLCMIMYNSRCPWTGRVFLNLTLPCHIGMKKWSIVNYQNSQFNKNKPFSQSSNFFKTWHVHWIGSSIIDWWYI